MLVKLGVVVLQECTTVQLMVPVHFIKPDVTRMIQNVPQVGMIVHQEHIHTQGRLHAQSVQRVRIIQTVVEIR